MLSAQFVNLALARSQLLLRFGQLMQKVVIHHHVFRCHGAVGHRGAVLEVFLKPRLRHAFAQQVDDAVTRYGEYKLPEIAETVEVAAVGPEPHICFLHYVGGGMGVAQLKQYKHIQLVGVLLINHVESFIGAAAQSVYALNLVEHLWGCFSFFAVRRLTKVIKIIQLPTLTDIKKSGSPVAGCRSADDVQMQLLLFVFACAVTYDDGIYFRLVAVFLVEFFLGCLNEFVFKLFLYEVNGAAAETAAHDT